MTAEPTPPTRRGRWHAAVAARATAQRGDTMIEVLVAALLVALVAGAVLTGYIGVAHLSAGERKHSQADTLAQQDEQRMRSLTVTQLAASGTNTGNETQTQTINGTTYTIQSTAQYISGSGASSCTAGAASSTADEVATTSTVSWPPSNDGRPPVVVRSVVTPGVGGSLIATATTPNPNGTNPTNVGLAGVTVAINGPSSVPALVTDANGCAVFGGLTAGSYIVTFTPPAGSIDVNGGTTFAPQTVTVTATQTANATIGPLALPGTLNATFSTAFNGQTNVAATSDQFIAANTGMTGGYRTFGTDSTASNSTFVSAINTGATIFPFGTSYVTFAGGCNNTPPAAGQVPAIVTAGQTTNVTLPEPAMIVLPYTPSSTIVDDRDPTLSYTSGWNNAVSNASAYDATESDSTSSLTSTKVTLAFSGTAVAVLATTGNFGIANVSVDGGASTAVDLYSATAASKQVVYSTYGLAPGAHTITISASGTKNLAATSKFIDIDAIAYGTPIFVDDRGAALSYASGWNNAVANANDYAGTESDSTSASSTATYTFTGTSVQLIARKASNLGIASVKVDSGPSTLVDLYSASTLYQQAVYSSFGLAPGPHTLTITATGTKNAASGGTVIDVDAVDSTPATALDDRDPSGAFNYSSGWTAASNASDFAGTETDSNTATTTHVTVTFTGNAVAWIAKTAPSLGKATVSVDGGAATTVDLYSASTLYQQTVYTAGNLAFGVHTLTITVTNTKNAASTGYTIDVDEILPLVLMSTRPNIITTDTDAACANNKDYPPEQIPTATQGALVNPGMAYGTYTICVDDGTNHDSITSFANTNYGSTGNIANTYLYSGAPGFGSGVCT